MEQWAEIRRMPLSRRSRSSEIARRTGAAPRHDPQGASPRIEPPRYGPRPPAALQARPLHMPRIHELLDDEPTLSGVRIREEIAEERAIDGGKTILDDYLRELRPRYLPPPRTHQRTVYRPGELCQFDLCEPQREIPVGHGQTRARLRRHRRAALLARLRRRAGLLQGASPTSPGAMSRCLSALGALPEKLVWDREGAIAPARSPDRRLRRLLRAARRSAGSSSTPATARPRARSSAPTASCTATSRPAGASPIQLDFQDQLDRWCRARQRRAPTAPPAPSSAERLAAERERMRAAARADARHRPALGHPRPAPALPALRPQRLLARPAPGRPPGRGPRRPGARSPRRPRHRRARLPPPPRLRRRAHLHRPRPPARRSTSCAASAADAGESPRSRSARWPAMTRLIPA